MAEVGKRGREEVEAEEPPQASIATLVVFGERALKIDACAGKIADDDLQETPHSPRECRMTGKPFGLCFGEEGLGARARSREIPPHHIDVDATVEDGPIFRRSRRLRSARRPRQRRLRFVGAKTLGHHRGERVARVQFGARLAVAQFGRDRLVSGESSVERLGLRQSLEARGWRKAFERGVEGVIGVERAVSCLEEFRQRQGGKKLERTRVLRSRDADELAAVGRLGGRCVRQPENVAANPVQQGGPEADPRSPPIWRPRSIDLSASAGSPAAASISASRAQMRGSEARAPLASWALIAARKSARPSAAPVRRASAQPRQILATEAKEARP